MGTGDLAEAFPQTTDARDVDEGDEKQRMVVDDHGYRDDVRRRREEEALVVNGRWHRAIIEDAWKPHGASYRPRQGDPLQRVAQLGVCCAVFDVTVEGEVAVVCEQ